MNHRTTLALIGLLTLGGCAASQSGRESAGTSAERTPVAHQHGGSARQGMMGQRDMSAMCPMRVPHTTAQATHVAGAAALAFTTTGDVAELRRRVAQMAEMHNSHHGADSQPPMMHGERGHADSMHEPKGMMGGMGMMPAADAKIEEIPGGARIVFTPRDAAQLDSLREHVVHMAERMASDGCPMISEPAASESGAQEPVESHEHHRSPGE